MTLRLTDFRDGSVQVIDTATGPDGTAASGHAPALLALLDDAEPMVRHRAEQCLEAFSRRLDRDFR